MPTRGIMPRLLRRYILKSLSKVNTGASKISLILTRHASASDIGTSLYLSSKHWIVGMLSLSENSIERMPVNGCGPLLLASREGRQTLMFSTPDAVRRTAMSRNWHTAQHSAAADTQQQRFACCSALLSAGVRRPTFEAALIPGTA